jgi:hypothetical protein
MYIENWKGMGLGNSMLQMGMIYPGDTAFW